VWDGTYVGWRGKQYKVITILDLGTRDVVAQGIVQGEDAESLIAVLDGALVEGGVAPEILHGDGGVAHPQLEQAVIERGIQLSKPDKGERHTNQVMERYNSTLKKKLRELIKEWGAEGKTGTLEEALEEAMERYRKEEHSLYKTTPHEASAYLYGVTLPEEGVQGNTAQGKKLRKQISKALQARKEGQLLPIVGGAQNLQKVRELIGALGLGKEFTLGQLQTELQMYQIAQQERHFKEITERLDDMAERLDRLADISEDWGLVKQLEKEIRDQRKIIDRYVLAEPELMQKLENISELERTRHTKVGRLKRRLSDHAKRLNRRYTMDVEQQADGVQQKLRKERPAKLPVREVPDELLNKREAHLAKKDNKMALRLLLAYKIMRRTGMRVGNLRLLTDQ
jgi:hypothetical protein